MSEITRRDALTRIASAFAATAAIDYALGRDVHAFTQAARGPYVPKALNAQQFRTLEALTDLIIPVDNSKPGAVQAGVPAWIDQLLSVNAELRKKYEDGFVFLDTAVKAKGATDFATAAPAQQTAVLDLIAYKKNASPELN